jgi:hypothetical protein
MLDAIGAGVDDTRDQYLTDRQRKLLKHCPLMFMPGIGALDRKTGCIRLVDDVENVGQGDVVVVRSGIIAPADVDANLIRVDTRQRVVQYLDMELYDISEFREG